MGNCHLISSKWINFLKAQPFVFCRSCFLVALIIKRSLEEAVEGQARNGQFPIQFCWQNPPLDCVLGMQNQLRGRARKMSSSFFNCCGYEKLLIVTWLLRQGGNRGCFRCLMGWLVGWPGGVVAVTKSRIINSILWTQSAVGILFAIPSAQ